MKTRDYINVVSSVVSTLSFGIALGLCVWWAIENYGTAPTESHPALPIGFGVLLGLMAIGLTIAACAGRGSRVFGEIANALGILGVQIVVLSLAFFGEKARTVSHAFSGPGDEMFAAGAAAVGCVALITSGVMFFGMSVYGVWCTREGNGLSWPKLRCVVPGACIAITGIGGIVFMIAFVLNGSKDVKNVDFGWLVAAAVFLGVALFVSFAWCFGCMSRKTGRTWASAADPVLNQLLAWTLIPAGIFGLLVEVRSDEQSWTYIAVGYTIASLVVWAVAEICILMRLVNSWGEPKLGNRLMYRLDGLLAIPKLTAICLLIAASRCAIGDSKPTGALLNAIALILAAFGIYARVGCGLVKLALEHPKILLGYSTSADLWSQTDTIIAGVVAGGGAGAGGGVVAGGGAGAGGGVVAGGGAGGRAGRRHGRASRRRQPKQSRSSEAQQPDNVIMREMKRKQEERDRDSPSFF